MLIPEFEKQSFTQVVFPHKNTDWNCCLEDAKRNFVAIINAIRTFQPCLVVCHDTKEVQSYFEDHTNIKFIEYTANDTWARDSSALTVENNGEIKLLNFTFNAWGGKFDAELDNNMSPAIASVYSAPLEDVDLILEGGGVESNGEGLILTTSECMLNPNRNKEFTKEQMTQKLKEYFGAKEILYLDHGYLAGDDTDSHIDTLARFISKDTIMYVACDNPQDEHYEALKKMEDELKEFVIEHKLKLIKLPMSSAVYDEDERLPATYANFLLVNGGVIVPTYNVKEDAEALEIFKWAFPDRRIVGVDCSTLIRQHGSLHCVTMNFASGVTLL
ncbi:agmatine deiminase family protein [Sulfurimonas marina]|uniref:Agmatine deiminase family protein n=1 Tax=Sulfurimonas marina TaxID=2590551 RepID=A0A7M3V9Q5_9BACT|nr:agmatine deiminase family protein [Sulfurimonas marina]QOP40488.1 agmatine deiminase family protein [Sulfurimonas marina]